MADDLSLAKDAPGVIQVCHPVHLEKRSAEGQIVYLQGKIVELIGENARLRTQLGWAEEENLRLRSLVGLKETNEEVDAMLGSWPADGNDYLGGKP